MDNKELLKSIEISHEWTAESILKLRELVKNEEKFTQAAITEMRQETLMNIQLNITEMKILALELEA